MANDHERLVLWVALSMLAVVLLGACGQGERTEECEDLTERFQQGRSKFYSGQATAEGVVWAMEKCPGI